MDIWKYTYAYDMFIDDRITEEVQLFSTKENAFKYAEQNGKPRSEFKGNDNDGYYTSNDVGEWDKETFYIYKVVLDEALSFNKR